MNKKEGRFPPDWDEERVRRVIAHYEEQSEDRAVAEDEAAAGIVGAGLIISQVEADGG